MKRTSKQIVSSTFVVALLVLAAGRYALAESDASDYEYTSPTAFHQAVAPWPVEMGFWQSHCSTVAEGFLRGNAAVIQSWGNFLLAQSQAAILFEQGRALDRENDLKQTQALLAQHAMWREAREAKREHFEQRLIEGRAKIITRRTTVHRLAYQLSPEDFNVVTGEIQWPAAFAAAKYQPARERLEELFRQHVGYGESQPGIAAEIARTSDALARALRSDIRTLTPADYLAAQKFLLGLKLEASDA